MSSALASLLPAFVPDFVRALGTNLWLAGQAVGMGLPLGAALALARLGSPAGQAEGALRRATRRGAGIAVGLLRAAPTFVVLHFMLHALPSRWSVGPALAVALALAAYAAAYVADNALEALRDWRGGDAGSALLFLMGLARAYFVMVLSTGFGAAVGVVEATAVTLRALERLPTAGDRLLLLAGVVATFVALFQGVYALIDAGRRRLVRRLPA